MNEDKASRYHRLKRRARVASVVGGAACLAVFLVSGASAWLRDASAACAVLVAPAYTEWISVAAYVVALFFAAEAVALPLSLYSGFLLDKRYGLGRETLASWLADAAKAGALGLSLALVSAQLVYWLLRVLPGWWWLPAAAAFSAFTVLITFAAPVVLLPLFYKFEPLEREALRDRLLGLAARAGTRVLGIYEWKLGAKTRAANAALVGLGRTRRIVVSDTLLGEYSDDEIEVVLAHELGHHVHGDIRTMIAADAAQTVAMLLLCHVALVTLAARLGLRGPADVAGLPLLVLVAAAWSLLAAPVLNAWSRRHERRADRYALDLTGKAEAFVSVMKRLGTQNLAEEHPGKIVEWLFHSHPPLPQRIEAARAWESAAASGGAAGDALPSRDAGAA